MESESHGMSLSLTQPPLEDVDSNHSQYSSLTEGNASLFATVFNGLNSIIGPGIILIPYTLASGGWLSLLFLSIVVMVATYTGVLIERCMKVNPRIKAFQDIGEYAFGHIGKVVMSMLLCAELYMVDTGFLILEGDNLHKLFPKVVMQLYGVGINGKSVFIIIVAIILLPTVWLDNLSILAYISTCGVLASILILGSILWVGEFDGIGFNHKGILVNWKGIPTSINLFMVSYCAHPVFPTLYTSMQNKHHFSKVLFLSFFISTIIYISIAVSGYLMFGSAVESQITLNLPTNKISSQIGIYTTFITPLAKYALVLKPLVISIESWFPIKHRNNRFFKITVRTMLVIFQVLVALAIPVFGDLMSFVGALLSTTNSFTIPCLCYLKISSINSDWQAIVERIFLWIIVVLSLFIIIFGTYTSLENIIKDFSH